MDNAAPEPANAPAGKKPNLLRRLYNWTVSWAETRYGTPALATISFAESSFFPIPPDVLLIALTFGSPKKWLRFALVCSIASVAGGVFGWWIGHAFWDALNPYFYAHVPGFTPERFEHVRQLYLEGAFMAVLLAAFTPIPYKIFTVASGVFGVPIPTLVFASLLGRSGRFFLVAGLIRLFGPAVRPFLEKHFEWLALLFGVLLVLGFVCLKYVM